MSGCTDKAGRTAHTMALRCGITLKIPVGGRAIDVSSGR